MQTDWCLTRWWTASQVFSLSGLHFSTAPHRPTAAKREPCAPLVPWCWTSGWLRMTWWRCSSASPPLSLCSRDGATVTWVLPIRWRSNLFCDQFIYLLAILHSARYAALFACFRKAANPKQKGGSAEGRSGSGSADKTATELLPFLSREIQPRW